ncbi:SIR2 family NAD-dependent protein deacylase [Halpernia frigidisoli]|uniref:NAD-dependent protein deacylase n=1 Tax=Halpernia frigidisoli TaxID=1125876 RepID=A0A1I3E339_9FLAO|nr:NAD-dependent deacylase [Halpernia frigidisoli]SFH93258.1 NAD-dependent deacetylase [Halpernia frigidisoli]
MKKNLVVLSGAGISAESGIKTFRDFNGLWENHRVEDVASPEGFARDPKLVLDFYNARRKQLSEVFPNEAHKILADLEKDFNVEIITQNVDDLHERAGSTKVLHLHGELLKARSVLSDDKIIDWKDDMKIGDLDENGIQIRPHIVWFGEMVPELENAAEKVSTADFLIIVGTSLQVYPAAGLVDFAPENCEIFVIDPNLEEKSVRHTHFYKMSASEGMKIIQKKLKIL